MYLVFCLFFGCGFFCSFLGGEDIGLQLGRIVFLESKHHQCGHTAEAGDGGSITNEGTTTAMYIENTTYTITPDEGFEIESVYIDGVDIGVVSKYTFTFSTEPQSIYVTFREKPWKNPFKDIYETDIYYDAIEFVTKNGIMDGITRNAFKPKAAVKHSEFIMILGKAVGVDISEYAGYDFTGFIDIDENADYAPYAAWAIENGITHGSDDGRFGAGNKISLRQALVMIARYAAGIGLPVDALDSDMVMAWAVNIGLFPADTHIDLDDNAVRTDVAVMLYAISAYINAAE